MLADPVPLPPAAEAFDCAAAAAAAAADDADSDDGLDVRFVVRLLLSPVVFVLVFVGATCCGQYCGVSMLQYVAHEGLATSANNAVTRYFMTLPL